MTGGPARDHGEGREAGAGADESFAHRLIAWQRRSGRHALPWQKTRDPYRIWVSEIMLQQTQVQTVLGYYARFIERFPDVSTLAGAEPDEVLAHWSGLGYYSRARNLHACARLVMSRHGGAFPDNAPALEALPGIGRSTAAAIAAFAWGRREAILDGNVKRVLCRVFGIEGFPGERAVEQRLWTLATSLLPVVDQPKVGDRGVADAQACLLQADDSADAGGIEAYTQGLMDLGATVCLRARPRCELCPMSGRCEARRHDRVAELPTRRAARAVEVRRAELVLLCADARVLLERRPPRGLWGGLWSLPEFRAPYRDAGRRNGGDVDGGDVGTGDDVAAQVVDWARTRFGLGVSDITGQTEIRHAFTHFRLQARVWHLDCRSDEAPSGHTWLALREAGNAPLPQPVRALLATLDARD